VEIVTSKAQTPSPTWERFVVTGKARARIRRFIRTQQRTEFVALGRSMIHKSFRQEGYEFAEKALEGVLKVFKCNEVEDLYALVGEGKVSEREVIGAVFPGTKPGARAAKVVPLPRARPKGKNKPGGIPIRGLIPGMAVHYAGCCHPLPGDRIVGIVTTGKGVTIHTIDCDTLASFAETPERWIDVAWETSEDNESRVGRVALVVSNEPGSLGALSTVIAKNAGNITNLKVTNRTQQFWEMLIDIEVRDVKHLTNIIAALRATPAINSVERARG
jgi:GTP pyrophosphokinase